MRQRFLLTTLAAGLLGMAAPGWAATATFTFEDQPIGASTPLAITANGLTAIFSGPAGVDPDAFEVSANSGSGPFPAPYRTLTTSFLTVGNAFGAAGSPLRIAFSAPVSAISLLFALDDPADTTALSLATNAGGTTTASGALSPGFRSPEGVLSFSGAPFTSAMLSTAALDFQIDDLTATIATATSAVPEPASLALFGAGLAATALRRRARG